MPSRRHSHPVYSTIRNEPGNATRLDQIAANQAIALHRAPDTADCTNVAADQPAATRYDGTYQMSIVWPKVKTADASCVGGPEDGPPMGRSTRSSSTTAPPAVELGRVAMTPNARSGWEGPYKFFKDQLRGHG